MPPSLTSNEEAQLLQTIEMFEVITQSQPLDCQSLEILKEAYFKLGRQKEVVNTAKRIAEAYVKLGQLSSAILEYEGVLQLFPDDPDVQQALSEIENQANSMGPTALPAEAEPEKPRPDSAKPLPAGGRAIPTELDDGRKTMEKLFVESKLISEGDFNLLWPKPDAYQDPSQPVEPFLQLISDKGICPVDKGLRTICEKSRICYLPLERYDMDVELARSFPKETCRRWCVVPIDRMSKSVLVATANPFNKQAARDLESAGHGRVIWYLASPMELIATLRKIFRS